MRKLSWGRVHRYDHDVWSANDPTALRRRLAAGIDRPLLAYGLGRSYGDSCLNDNGVLVDTTRLDHFLTFDRAHGILRAEAGVTLAQTVNLLARRADVDGSAWFLPVSPGTSFVTLGGAVANDVHGKNHHALGTFGRHVRRLWLLRSDVGACVCSPTENPELFRATIGGLGLTGLILEVELQLRRVPGLAVANEDIRFDNLDEFYALSADSSTTCEYSVAWVDCLAGGDALGRGWFARADHVTGPAVIPELGRPRRTMPLTPPVSPLNRWSVSLFNAFYWRRLGPRRHRHDRRPVTDVLYPLDGIAHWNRLYGRAGFYQYQCVIPEAAAPDAVRELLVTIGRSGEGSFLAVLKTMGATPSPGFLSFPLPGTPLALDFPNRGATTLALLDRLDAITSAAGGRLYPAKDGRMDGRFFRSSYPALDRFTAQLDPAFSSSFWRRMEMPSRPRTAA